MNYYFRLLFFESVVRYAGDSVLHDAFVAGVQGFSGYTPLTDQVSVRVIQYATSYDKHNLCITCTTG